MGETPEWFLAMKGYSACSVSRCVFSIFIRAFELDDLVFGNRRYAAWLQT